MHKIVCYKFETRAVSKKSAETQREIFLTDTAVFLQCNKMAAPYSNSLGGLYMNFKLFVRNRQKILWATLYR